MTPSTGLPGLDQVLQGLHRGDCIVWRLDAIEDYAAFVHPFCEDALARQIPVHHFRFTDLPSVVPRDPRIAVHEVGSTGGFETFVAQVHDIIRMAEAGARFVFDPLSGLLDICHSDRMAGHFLRLTCPRLAEKEGTAYFGVFRGGHSLHAAAAIEETAQLLLDVYHCRGRYYVQPQKAENRHSSTLYQLHAWAGQAFHPVEASGEITEILGSSPWPGLPSASYRMIGAWDRLFMHAEELLDRGTGTTSPETPALFRKLARLILTRDDRMLDIAEHTLTLADLIAVWKRMIGTGRIGGKALGMLLSNAILAKARPDWQDRLEQNDSFFIGSDVFYAFLVDNQCWWQREAQKNPETFLDQAAALRETILHGAFPEDILRRFSDMLDYFGQCPIIVRSSSLLEDHYGNAFAGKYESIFCPNQGTRNERRERFLDAVRRIYASTVSEEALRYRKKRQVLDRDEQMALLVQRVSGTPQGDYFYPHLAGVGFSFNPYAWNKRIDPDAGMIRLVFGLGTRAVDRVDDDYTRVVALNAPELRPESDFQEVRQHAQRKVDVLDLKADRLVQMDFADVARQSRSIPLNRLTSADPELEAYLSQRGLPGGSSVVLTFEELLKEPRFTETLRELMRTLRRAYGTHVDIEFTAHLTADQGCRINLLQCRPLQVQPTGPHPLPETQPAPGDLLLHSRGAVIGQSRVCRVDRLVYVSPSGYSRLPEPRRHALAQLIGRICHLPGPPESVIALIGPGRWGTSTPSLGVPVAFHHISPASILCEIDFMHEGLVPDLSLGTHFFNEMVEMNQLYLALQHQRPETWLDMDYLEQGPDRLAELMPEAADWAGVVRILACTRGPQRLHALGDSMEQRALLYWQ